MSNAGDVDPTGRCRAYPRENVQFFESFQTAGIGRDPPPDWALRRSASEYGGAHPIAHPSVETTLCGALSNTTHPREERGMGNV
ncbi:hypothetical protein GCM10010274_04510 [Streptomyces lavendofoliae]|uniref:Uncharacterized protein n=1 Tax=Streptomyces lavendofoliae TaxID=67314 RepID=A0A918HSD8_9ACTN|nr:hypothetical protein GCM10010274_04510 [Streptomyces lavendofoliae]